MSSSESTSPEAPAAPINTPPRPAAPPIQRARTWAWDSSLAAAGSLMDGVSHGLRRVPRRARYVPADAVTFMLRLLWHKRMPIITDNFATALDLPPNDPRTHVAACASVRNFGRMAIDFLTVRTMAPEDILQWTDSGGEDIFASLMAEGKGAIFALPHAGSWDVAAAFAQAYGVQLTVVTESNWATELVAGSRREHGIQLAPRDQASSLRHLFRALTSNGVVVMLADLANEGVQSINVPFFGRPAPFPVGPARLAHRTGAPICIIESTKLPDGRYHVAINEVVRPDRSARASDEVARLTSAIAAGFERIIAASPTQWYPFHPVWPHSVTASASAPAAIPHDDAAREATAPTP